MSHARLTAALEKVPTADTHSQPGFRSQARIDELQLKIAELRKDYVELHAALFEAAQVHRRLCAPRFLRYGDFEIASEIFAVRHLAGDFFTVQKTGGRIVLALGDISGKGVAAAMWTTLLVGAIGMQAAADVRLEAIVAAVNSDLCVRSPVAPMASLFLAALDPVSGTLEYCSAGHPPALLLRAGGQLEALSDGGPLLGALPGASFVTGRVELCAGDILLAYSDGILEARNGSDEEFGRTRLESQLRQASTRDVETVLFSILGAVRDFAAEELADDTSLVVVGRKLERAETCEITD